MEDNQRRYRTELAGQLLRAQKSERNPLLREAKRTFEYIDAHSLHSIGRSRYQNRKEIEDIVKKSSNVEEIMRSLKDTRDRSEWILKRIEMAQRFNMPEITPDIGGLREFVTEELARVQGPRADALDIERYKDYLQERLAEYKLTPRELDRVALKVQEGTFLFLDREMEKPVLLMNTIPDTMTLYSCSGHVDGLDSPENDWLDAANAYLFFNTRDQALLDAIRSLAEQNERYQITMDSPDERGDTIRFKKLVPKSWIRDHGRRSYRELFEESKKRLSEILGPGIQSVLWEEEKDNEYELFKKVLELQDQYLKMNPASAYQSYGVNSKVLSILESHLMSRLEWQEYKDFYLSPESEADRLLFLKRLTDTIYGRVLLNRGS